MRDNALLNRQESLYIDGRWIRPDSKPMTVVNPSSANVFGQILPGTKRDANSAADAAAAAFPSWSRIPSSERSSFLAEFAAGLKKRHDLLVELQMLNNGKPRSESECDVADAVATFEYYAGLALELDRRQGSEVPLLQDGFRASIRHEPVGAVGLIVPWNFPLVTSAWKIAPALASGCTVVLKTSEFTPFAELVYGVIADEIALPAGVLNVVTGGSEVGHALAASRALRKISFTGSNRVGSLVMKTAADRTAPVTLELGGKSAIIVFSDADLDEAVELVIGGIFTNAGQMCSATSRLLVEDAVMPGLVDKLLARISSMKVADPFSGRVDMGPMTTPAQFDRIKQVLDRAHEWSAPVVGGSVVDGDGFFVQPTVYLDVPLEHELWRKENFGPILAVRSFISEDEAIRIANDTDYGLVATLITADPNRAARVATAMEAGTVWINAPQVIFPQTAWGGFKASGFGRELGPWGLASFMGTKHVVQAI